MSQKREYPERPVVGVGGVVIRDGQVLLVRRGSEPLKGEWSIPGGTLELGETIAEGVARELREETGLEVRVLDLIEVFERIFPGEGRPQGSGTNLSKYKYHFVILDYLCEAPDGAPQPGSDVTDVAFAGENELARFHLTPTATRVIQSAFRIAKARRASLP